LKRLGFRYRNFLAQLLSEISKACTIRVRRLSLGRLWNDLGAHAGLRHWNGQSGTPAVNRLVYESSPTHFFASLFYGEYEPATRVLNYVNAGHNPPIVVRPRKDSCEIYTLKSEGIPVGIFADSQFATTTFQFEIDDVLVGYTDGITEVDPHGEIWGQQRLENLLRSCSRGTPEQIIHCILDEVSSFADGQKQRDDMTLVVMTVQEGCDL
jgi:sigma-B regulation protein RsbU (phosphoserine phosphatase)